MAAEVKKHRKRYIKVGFYGFPRPFICAMCGDSYKRAAAFHVVFDFPSGQFIFGKPLKRNGGRLALNDHFLVDYIRVAGEVCRTCILTITDQIDRLFESSPEKTR